MIRDEFKNLQKNEKLSTKEIEGIRRLGERSYYTTEINKILMNKKSITFSTWFTFVFGIAITVIVIVYAVVRLQFLFELLGIIGLTVAILTNTWTVLWFFVFKKNFDKKIEYYRQKLKELKIKEMEKQKSIQAFYNKNNSNE